MLKKIVTRRYAPKSSRLVIIPPLNNRFGIFKDLILSARQKRGKKNLISSHLQLRGCRPKTKVIKINNST